MRIHRLANALNSFGLPSSLLRSREMFRTDVYFEETTGHVNYCSCSFYSGYNELEASMRPGVRRAYSSGRCCCNSAVGRVIYDERPRTRKNSRADDFFSYANQPSSPLIEENVNTASRLSLQDPTKSTGSSTDHHRSPAGHEQVDLPIGLSPLKEVDDSPALSGTQHEQFPAENSASPPNELESRSPGDEVPSASELLSPTRRVDVQRDQHALPQGEFGPTPKMPPADRPSRNVATVTRRAAEAKPTECRGDAHAVDSKHSFNKEIVAQVKSLSMKDQYNILKQKKKNTLQMCCSIS